MSNSSQNHWENQHQASQQKRLQNQKIKQEYKSRAENALDNLISEYEQAKTNQIADWNPNPKDKAQINRFYKRYWDNNFFAYAIVVAIITFLLSFYSSFAGLGILVVFILQFFLSQNSFLKYYFNDYQIEKEDFEYLKSKIFGRQLNILVTFIIAIVLTILSLIMNFYTIGIYINPEKFSIYLNVLSRFYPFYMENELFAYTNVFSIFILILLKVMEKWR
jgi:ABC-type multidrug transport system fused ATPase/permease subunit